MNGTSSGEAQQSLAADGAIACFSSNLVPAWLNADRAPQLKAGVMPFLVMKHGASLAALLLVASVIACSNGQPLKKIDKSPAMQQGRADIIRELTEKGLFAKIEDRGPSVDLWVRSQWYTLDYDKKETFANIVYSYYFDGGSVTDKVIIIDAASGDSIGQHSIATGGLHLK